MKHADVQTGQIYQVKKTSYKSCSVIYALLQNQAAGQLGMQPTSGMSYRMMIMGGSGTSNPIAIPPQVLVIDKVPGILQYHILDAAGRPVAKCDCLSAGDIELLPDAVIKKDVKVGMESVIIHPDKIEQIQAAISQMKNYGQIFDDWGFSDVFEKGTAVSMVFWGVPGTGKTLMAQAISDSLEMKLRIINTGEIRSSEPGGAERTIKKIFQDAQKAYEAGKAEVILFDECDSLLVDRAEVGVIIGAEVNALLTQLEHYKGIVIFTTNRLGKLDPALERRIMAKIEFEFPDQKQREKIWLRMIPKKAPIDKDVDFKKLAETPLTGGHIKNAVLNAARKAAYLKLKKINTKCFSEAIQHEIVGMQQFEDAHRKIGKIPRLLKEDTDIAEDGSSELQITERMKRMYA